ncbi:hypothetical protein ACFW16_32680 [Inquilinus sp. NPDC058860]|uniref:hypothetical protein n=1 Tax=Inquilinus sp. NPDC058860 TaxID=3346652 RepID=UPI00369FC732
MIRDPIDTEIMRGLGDGDGDGDEDDGDLNLTIEEAQTLSDRELHRRVRTIVQDLEATFGRGVLPPDLPWRASAMTRDELLLAVETHAYWFDPRGRHPYLGPDRQI